MDILQLNAPSGWKISIVGESYTICNQFREPINATVRENMKGEYPYYGPTQVVDYLDHYHLDGKYALIGEDGDHFLKYATRPMTQLATGKFNVNNHAHIIQSTEECSVEWFYYFFMHTSIFPFLTRQGAGRYKLNKAALEQIPILIPPLSEQRQITEILSTWDETIDLTEQLIAAKQRRKQALMQRLLAGQVRFSGFADGWEMVTIEDVTSKVGSGITPKGGSESYLASGIPLIRSQNVLTGVLNLEDVAFISEHQHNKMSATQLKTKDVLLNITGASIGRSCVVPVDFAEGNVNQHVCIIRPTEQLNSTFLSAFLNSAMGQRQIDAFQAGGNRQGLNYAQIRSFKIPLPTIEEQEKIAQVLQICDEELDLLQQKLTALRQQKQGLMQQLLTGKIRVKV